MTGNAPEQKTPQSGFTLIETMIAMAILAISLLALAQLVGVAINQNASSRSGSVAIAVAQGYLEELRTQYNKGLETGTPSSALTAGTHSTSVILPGYEDRPARTFDITWNVTPVATAELRVRLSAESRTGNFLNSRSVVITSYFAP